MQKGEQYVDGYTNLYTVTEVKDGYVEMIGEGGEYYYSSIELAKRVFTKWS